MFNQFSPRFYDDEQDHNTEFDDPLLHVPRSTPHNYRVFLSNLANRSNEAPEKPQPPSLDYIKTPDDEIV